MNSKRKVKSNVNFNFNPIHVFSSKHKRTKKNEAEEE